MVKHWYVVIVGRKVGVFDNWIVAGPLVKGIEHAAIWQKFDDEQKAHSVFAEAELAGTIKIVGNPPASGNQASPTAGGVARSHSELIASKTVAASSVPRSQTMPSPVTPKSPRASTSRVPKVAPRTPASVFRRLSARSAVREIPESPLLLASSNAAFSKSLGPLAADAEQTPTARRTFCSLRGAVPRSPPLSPPTTDVTNYIETEVETELLDAGEPPIDSGSDSDAKPHLDPFRFVDTRPRGSPKRVARRASSQSARSSTGDAYVTCPEPSDSDSEFNVSRPMRPSANRCPQNARSPAMVESHNPIPPPRRQSKVEHTPRSSSRFSSLHLARRSPPSTSSSADTGVTQYVLLSPLSSPVLSVPDVASASPRFSVGSKKREVTASARHGPGPLSGKARAEMLIASPTPPKSPGSPKPGSQNISAVQLQSFMAKTKP